MSRYARRKDDNHGMVVNAFRAIGCSWLTIEGVAGAPDGALGVGGRTHLVEIKDGAKVPSAQRLNAEQLEFAKTWRGGPVHVVRSTQDAVELVNLLRMVAR